VGDRIKDADNQDPISPVVYETKHPKKIPTLPQTGNKASDSTPLDRVISYARSNASQTKHISRHNLAQLLFQRPLFWLNSY
jgi:hypothetical protein